MASEKVGRSFPYPAVCRTDHLPCCACRFAHSVTSENSPNKAGVARAIANSLHGRWVSTAVGFPRPLGFHGRWVSTAVGFPRPGALVPAWGGFQLPAKDEPAHDLFGGGRQIGTQQRLRSELAF